MTYSDQDIIDLHHKYAPSKMVYRLVFEHCRIVCEIAEQLIAIQNLHLDAELVHMAALLHDIGAYPLFKANGTLKEGVKYITHGIEGKAILKNEQLPEKVWRFAAHHTGVGLTKADITKQGLPLPVADYSAETDEELLVMYSDKFHSKTTPPYFNSFDWYKQDIARFGAEKAAAFEQMAAKFGKPDLQPLVDRYGFEVR